MNYKKQRIAASEKSDFLEKIFKKGLKPLCYDSGEKNGLCDDCPSRACKTKHKKYSTS